jgi:predicted CoA-binding protein
VKPITLKFAENMKTVVIGATPNSSRYAYMAVKSLVNHGNEVIPIGRKHGEIEGLTILNEYPAIEGVDTVSLYLNAQNQAPIQEYILSLKPKRIIFNPGAENSDLEAAAKKAGIKPVHGCTLIMLSSQTY